MANSVPATQAYTFNAPSGVPGDITRVDESNAEPIMLGNANAIAFGIPLKYDGSGNAIPFVGGEANTDFQGTLVRYAPGISGNTNQGLTDTTPNSAQVQQILVRGYMSVICTVGTPVRGGIVYIVINTAGGGAIGDFRATADGGNTIALSNTQASWAADGKDANNNAEIRVAR